MTNRRHDTGPLYRRQALAVAGTALTVTLSGCGERMSPADGPQESGSDAGDGTGTGSEEEPALRLRGEIVGTMATGITVPPEQQGAVKETVATELGLGPFDVRARGNVVEVYDSVSTEAFGGALEPTAVDASAATVESGVSAPTREETSAVIRDRLANAGISDTAVEIVETEDGGHTAIVDVFEESTDAGRVESLLASRGTVRVVASYPTDGGYDERQVLTHADFASVGEAQEGAGGRPPSVPVTLTAESAEQFTTVLVEQGFTSEGVNACEFETDGDEPPVEAGYCLYTSVDDDVVYAASLSQGLAQTIESGAFTENPQFVLTTQDFERAEQLEQYLRSGPLPAPLASITVE